MQIKTISRYYASPFRLTKMSNSSDGDTVKKQGPYILGINAKLYNTYGGYTGNI